MPDATQSLPEILARLDQIGRSLPAESQCPARITISAGVSRYPEDGSDAEALLEKADERMYDAKRSKKLLQVA
jgi:diguanylate cyclase (GGDEF)-like protein